jgi:hypothetical protein
VPVALQTRGIFVEEPSGNVGIGTTSLLLNGRLHVNGDGVDPSLRVQVNNLSKLIVAPNGGTTIGTNNLNPPSNGLYVAGAVGIGTQSPSHTLTVQNIVDQETMRLLGPFGGSALRYGARLNFGDADFAYIEEDLDDRLRIHARVGIALTGGNVGIGETNPSAKLDVVGTTELNGNVTINSNLTVDTDALFVDGAAGQVGIGTTSPDDQLHLQSNIPNRLLVETTDNSAFHFAGVLAKTPTMEYFFGACQGCTVALTPHWEVFDNLAGASRLRIDSAGNVGIGRTPTSNKLEVDGNASKTTAGDWLANSDRRIKKNIRGVENALDTLDKVRLVSFEYTDDYRQAHTGVGPRRYLNVIAQEFAKVFPDYVKSSGERLPDGSEILQVDAYPLTIYAAAAVQELHRQVQEKDAVIAAVRSKNAELEARVERIERLLAHSEGGVQ